MGTKTFELQHRDVLVEENWHWDSDDKKTVDELPGISDIDEEYDNNRTHVPIRHIMKTSIGVE
jgi:hypothetical protein